MYDPDLIDQAKALVEAGLMKPDVTEDAIVKVLRDKCWTDKIAIVWSVEDVMTVAEEVDDIDDEEAIKCSVNCDIAKARKVLASVLNHADAEHGVTWDTLRSELGIENTEIYYRYRDASNYKAHRSEVIAGQLLLDDIRPFLNDVEFFIPAQVGLDDLQKELASFPSDDDHVWHEMVSCEPTEKDTTLEITASELLLAFQKAHKGGWKVVEAMDRLGIE